LFFFPLHLGDTLSKLGHLNDDEPRNVLPNKKGARRRRANSSGISQQKKKHIKSYCFIVVDAGCINVSVI